MKVNGTAVMIVGMAMTQVVLHPHFGTTYTTAVLKRLFRRDILVQKINRFWCIASNPCMRHL
jgi:hypothetical protein